jgi:hypothetical protein
MSVTPLSSHFTPTPFVFKDRYVTVVCDLPDYEGFQAEIRKNLTNGELRDLRAELKAIEDEVTAVSEHYQAITDELAKARKQLDPGDVAGRHANTEAATQNLIEQFSVTLPIAEKRKALIVPYVRSWNLYDTSDDDNPVPIPPPQEAGVAAFDGIDNTLAGWLVNTVLTAYQGGRGFRSGSEKSDGAAEPTNEQSAAKPMEESSSPSPVSPKKSRSRSKPAAGSEN